VWFIPILGAFQALVEVSEKESKASEGKIYYQTVYLRWCPTLGSDIQLKYSLDYYLWGNILVISIIIAYHINIKENAEIMTPSEGEP